MAVAAEEELQPALRDHWEDVTTSFHDADAHHLYVSPELPRTALEQPGGAACCRASRATSRTSSAPRPPTRPRARCATQSLSWRSSCAPATAPWWHGHAAARRERAAYNLDRIKAAFLDGRPAPIGAGPGIRGGGPAGGLPLPAAQGGDHPRAPAAAPPPRRASGGPPHGRGRGGQLHRPARRARRSCTRTTASGASTGSRPRPWAASRATTWSSSSATATRCSCPSDQLHKISRYVGADAGDPPLSKLGGKQWEQQKLRARRAAEALAGELINLYAERKRRAGHAFPRDGEWQLEFEAAFPFRETPDQMEAIEAVRADMEEARPMDRLICGDVGYGKTEVALRAAFKAAADSQAGDVPRAHHGPRPAALRHVHASGCATTRCGSRWCRGSARPRRRAQALDGLRGGQGGHPDRHPPPALARRAPEGPRPADRRRGAALRRQAEGADAAAAAARRRDLAERDADPADAPDVARRACATSP